jgi:hypothetical protein
VPARNGSKRDQTACLVKAIRPGAPTVLLSGDREAGVRHAKWIKNPALQDIFKRRIFHACDEQAEEVGRVAIVE